LDTGPIRTFEVWRLALAGMPHIWNCPDQSEYMSLRIKAMILGLLLTTAAWSQHAEEYRVKAAFLFNFAKFVEWPPQAFTNSTDPIRICVLGKDPFGSVLEDAVRDKTAEGRTFLVRQVSGGQPAAGCQILFISSSERKRLAAILGEIKGDGVLTVGETDTFASDGGMINFKIESGRVCLQINVAAAEQSRLHISSKLLSLAQIVKR
jgi:hypothetical protein